MKHAISFLACLLIFTTAAPCFGLAMDQDAVVIEDTLVLRPLGLASIVFGTAFFIASLPFSVPSGSSARLAEQFIGDPMRYTFARPIGAVATVEDPLPGPIGPIYTQMP